MTTARTIKEIREQWKDEFLRYNREEYLIREFIDCLADEARPAGEYIDDLLRDVADQQTDIYNHELFTWLKDAPRSEDYMDQVIHESLIDTGREYDFFRHIQLAQYEYLIEKLYEVYDSTEFRDQVCIKYLENTRGEEFTTALDDDSLRDLFDNINDISTFSRVSRLHDEIENWLMNTEFEKTE